MNGLTGPGEYPYNSYKEHGMGKRVCKRIGTKLAEGVQINDAIILGP